MQESYLQFEFLSSYLAELSLIDYACIQYPPSIIAASAVFLARFTLDTNANPWVIIHSFLQEKYVIYKPKFKLNIEFC